MRYVHSRYTLHSHYRFYGVVTRRSVTVVVTHDFPTFTERMLRGAFLMRCLPRWNVTDTFCRLLRLHLPRSTLLPVITFTPTLRSLFPLNVVRSTFYSWMPFDLIYDLLPLPVNCYVTLTLFDPRCSTIDLIALFFENC